MGWFITLVVVIIIVVIVVQSVSEKPSQRGNEPSPSSRSRPARTFTATLAASESPIPSKRIRRRSSKPFELQWFGRDTKLNVAGITIENPCVYASSGEYDQYLCATDPSEIMLQAPVRRPSGQPNEMGYWPWYSRMDPGNRYEYLSWLASGRQALPPVEGYLFLYFYGIERRLLLDEADRAWALQEIVRLRRLDEPRVGTRDGRSFRQYSTGLLWFEIARMPDRFDEKALEHAMRLTERWTTELMTAPLSWLAANERPLPAQIAHQIAANDPTSQRSVVTKRLPEEFSDLFETRYHEAFGDAGMPLRISKRRTWHTYRPASGGLEEMRVQVANPMGVRNQFKKLPDIWNSCIADLRNLSRVSLSLDDGELTIDSWEAMPDELRDDVDHPLTDTVAALVADHADSASEGDDEWSASGATMVPAGCFAELLDIDRRPKLTPTQSRKVATTIEFAGYGLVPDARITPIRYGWDDLVAVVPGLDDNDVESSRYNAAACVLRLGLLIALADGEADEVELRMLTDHIDAVFDLSSEEQQRISALRDLLLRTGSDIRPIARKIEKMLPLDARRKVGRLLVVIAAATNGIDRTERAALRKAFRALRLQPELLEETIAEIAPEAGQTEVVVKSASRATNVGELIPEAPTAQFSLNHEAISIIMSETREVSIMLAEAMNAVEAESADEVEEEVCAKVTVTEAITAQATTTGPGGRYEPLFVALIARKRWNREDADDIARSHGLMLDAGVETINDWSYDALGAPLIEDEGDELVLVQSILSEIT